MDCRHPLTPQDGRLLDWLRPSGRAVHVLLSKCDKLSAQAAQRTVGQVRRDLAATYPGASAQLFSSLKRLGVPEAHACIEAWVAAHKQKAPAKGD
jgi:GTP-binding protein